jgi:hypothetical protein
VPPTNPFWPRNARSPLADHPKIAPAVILAPREIVMVVNLFDDAGPEDAGHAAANPVASRVSVQSAKPHALQLIRSQIGIGAQHARVNTHAVPGARRVQEEVSRLVSQPT